MENRIGEYLIMARSLKSLGLNEDYRRYLIERANTCEGRVNSWDYKLKRSVTKARENQLYGEEAFEYIMKFKG